MTFEEFFSEHYAGVVRSLALALGDPNGAEDAAVVAFAKAYRKWSTVGVLERPAGWVYVVALRAGRRAKPRKLPALRPAERASDSSDDRFWIISLLDTLTIRQRTAVVLRYYADLPVDEIATAMACAPGTVKATLHSSLQKMRVAIEQSEVNRAN